MEKKYELTTKTKEVDGHILQQIRACRTFRTILGTVFAGEVGGYIESGKNLSHDRNCWVDTEACVYGNAMVCEDAYVAYAQIFEFAMISGKSTIYGKSKIHGYTDLTDSSIVTRDADISIPERTLRKIHTANFRSNAFVRSFNDFLIIGPIGSRDDYTTFYKTKDNDIWVSCGCFNGSIKDFEAAVRHTHYFGTKYSKEYIRAIRYAKTVLA